MKKFTVLIIFLFALVPLTTWSQYDLKFVCFSKTQNCGVRSAEGDTIIPFRFNNISRIASDYYITHRSVKGRKEIFKMSIFDFKGKEVLPGEYDWIKPDLTYNCIYFHKDGHSGIFDLDTKRTVTKNGIYDISSIVLSKDQNQYDRLILLNGPKGSEVLNSNFNTLFTTEKYIRTYRPSSFSSPSVDSTIYSFGDYNSDKTGYLDANGKVIVLDQYTDYYWPTDHFSTFKDNTCFIATDGVKFDFYSSMGSEPVTGFQYLHFSDHYLTAKRDNKWLLLDNQLKPIFSDSKYGLSFCSGQFDPITFNYEDMFTEGSHFFNDHLISFLSPEYNFIYQIKFGQPIKNCDSWAGNCIKKQGKVGLSNVHSKQSIPVEYDYLLPFSYNNWFNKSHNFKQSAPNYFWALRRDGTKEKIELVIYNDQLKKEKSYNLNEESLDFLRVDSRNQGDTTTRVLVNEKGQYGMIRADGSIKVPFIYSRLAFTKPHQHNQVEHLYFGNDEHYGLFDSRGNMLLPVLYDTIYYPDRYEFNLIVGELDNSYTYYIVDTGEQINTISQVFEAEYLKKPDDNAINYSRKSSYFIKNGFLYVLDQNKPILIDKERIRIDAQEKEIFNKKIVIDKSGKVLKNDMRKLKQIRSTN